MSEQQIHNQNEQLPPPPDQSLLSRMSARYDGWVDGMLDRNPTMERGRLNMTVGILGGLAVVGAAVGAPDFAEHAAAAVRDPNPGALDVAAFSVTFGAAFATGMNYIDRRKAQKQNS